MGAAAILTILRNGETIKSCSIEGEAMLGRAEGCVIRLDDRAISRQHAVFKVVDGGVQVEKKSDFAPLVVNGIDCTRAVVKEADVISIGPYLMRVSLSKAQQPQQSAAQAESETAALQELTVPLDSPPADAATVPTGDALAGEVPEVSLEEPAAVAMQELESPPEPGAQADPAAGAPAEDALPDFNIQLGSPSPHVPHQSPAEVAVDHAALGFEGGAGSLSIDDHIEAASEDAATKLTPAAKLSVRLSFAPGAANVTDFELTKDEVSIGRGQNCDIVLNDKKASRKNAIIRRAGLSFTIKDLDSANGTFVNGVRVQEQELSGDDVIRIGGVEFQFKAMSADYSAREKNFMPVPEEPFEPASLSMADSPSQFPVEHLQHEPPAQLQLQASPAIPGAADPHGAGIPGITGIGPADVKRMSFIEKVRNFKQLPRKQQIMIGAILLGLAYFIFIDEDAPDPVKKAPPKKGAVTTKPVEKGPATFESLSPEQQRFVEAQHVLAFEYYKNKEYDKSLFELGKIFALINDYKDSRDIERYAKEGKRKLEAMEEEKRKKEEESRLKAKIQNLVDECKERMDKKQYEQAKVLFSDISVLDPDNAQVAAWKKEIERYEEDKRAAEQTKQVQEEINRHAWQVYQEGMGLKKQGKYHSAIDVLSKVSDMGASDAKVAAAAKNAIASCHAAIRKLRDPVLEEARQAETAQDYPKAYMMYKKATQIDPPHREGYAGIARVRGVLHERAKMVYTEAVLAESYSDFTTARKKYKECLEVSPVDDIYHERAERKLARYFKQEEAPQQ